MRRAEAPTGAPDRSENRVKSSEKYIYIHIQLFQLTLSDQSIKLQDKTTRL